MFELQAQFIWAGDVGLHRRQVQKENRKKSLRVSVLAQITSVVKGS
jgi:hypothetical protein